MLKNICVSFLCGMLFLFAGCGSQNIVTSGSEAFLQITDAAQRSVNLEKQPQRIISLSPSYLGLIDAIGGSVVGRPSSKNGDVPDSLQKVPEIGYVYNINMETVVSLKPDLVIAGVNQHDKFVPLLESNNIKVIEMNVKTYDEVKDALLLLGKIYGKEQQAVKVCADLDAQIQAVKDKMPEVNEKIIIMHATASSVTVEGEKSIAGSIGKMLGFENMAAQALQGKSEKTPYSMEKLVEQNPDIIFVTSMGKPEEIENRLRNDFQNNPAWSSLKAVKTGKVYVLPETLFLLNPGLRYPDAVKYMARLVYPKEFAHE